MSGRTDAHPLRGQPPPASNGIVTRTPSSLPQAMSGGTDTERAQPPPASNGTTTPAPSSPLLPALLGGIASRELGRAYRGFVSMAGAAIRHRLSDASDLGDDESKWPQVRRDGEGGGKAQGWVRGRTTA